MDQLGPRVVICVRVRNITGQREQDNDYVAFWAGDVTRVIKNPNTMSLKVVTRVHAEPIHLQFEHRFECETRRLYYKAVDALEFAVRWLPDQPPVAQEVKMM